MSDGVHDPGDPLMVTWVLAWVAHQLPNAPAHIFDANIFYPERNTLAYSESLLVPGSARRAAVLARRRADSDLQPGVPLGFRALRGGRRAAGAPADRPHRRRDSRRHRVRVSAVPHRSLRAPAAAADAVHSAGAVGVPSPARYRTRCATACCSGVFVACQMLSCMYYGIFLIPYMAVVCGTLLIASGSAAEAAADGAGGGRGDRDGHDGAGRPRVSRGAQSRGRARPAARSPRTARPGGTTWRRRRTTRSTARCSRASWIRSAGCSPDSSRSRSRSSALWPHRMYLGRRACAYGLGLLLAFDVSLGFNGVLYRGLYEYFLPFQALRIPARMGHHGRRSRWRCWPATAPPGSPAGSGRRRARRAALTSSAR